MVDSETNEIIYRCPICGKEVQKEKVRDYLRQEFDDIEIFPFERRK